MPFITIPIQPKQHQLTFYDIAFGVKSNIFDNYKNTYDTRTVYRDTTPTRLLENLDIPALIECLADFNARYKDLIETEDKSTLFHSFKIPKKSGGWRPIDAPNPRLMAALRDLKFIFECRFYANHHTCAFAYVKKRSTVMAVERHQCNGSKWFLKMDLHNFFGKTTLDFVIAMFAMVYPFSEIVKVPEGLKELKTSLSLAFLNGGLPQGTPISPLITNIMMIPVDHAISKIAREHTPFIVYTRYADDMQFSAVSSFEDRKLMWDIKTLGEKLDKLKSIISPTEQQVRQIEALSSTIDEKVQQTDVLSKVIDILKRVNAPFEINAKKTHYANSNGRNWMLGVMLNKDNQITLGHAKKNNLKIDVFNFMQAFKKGSPWSVVETQELEGRISYHSQIEKDVTTKILQNYSNKFGFDVRQAIKSVISGK